MALATIHQSEQTSHARGRHGHHHHGAVASVGTSREMTRIIPLQHQGLRGGCDRHGLAGTNGQGQFRSPSYLTGCVFFFLCLRGSKGVRKGRGLLGEGLEKLVAFGLEGGHLVS